MRATGVVRKIDSVGRVVVPIEMMKSLGMTNGDSIEFLLFNERYIILQKHKPCISLHNNVKIIEGEIIENNAAKLEKIDETIRLLNKVKKLYTKYLGMD